MPGPALDPLFLRGLLSFGSDPRQLANALGAPVPSAPTGSATTNLGPISPVPIGERTAHASPVPRPTPVDGKSIGDLVAAFGPRIQGPLNFSDSIQQALVNNASQTNPEHKVLGLKPEVVSAILGSISDGLLAYSGMQPEYAPAMQRRQEIDQQNQFDREKLNAELEAKRQAALAPRAEQVGNTIGLFDPSALSFNPVYTAPEPFENYAASLGYKPGTPEYIQAVKDYRLGSYSDPAIANRKELTGYRYDRSDAQLDRRLATTERGQDLTHRDRQASVAQSNTNSARSAETTRGAYSYSHPSSRGRGHVTNEPTAVGPGGKTIVFRGGHWVDASTGKPVG